MNRLLEIGFHPAGHWHLEGETLRCELSRFATQRNVLYAFVTDGAVKYIGKTVTPLRARMRGYERPSGSQTTNHRNHAQIRELLERGRDVEIFVLPDSGLLHYGRFHLNLAAGLEDDVIRTIDPPWNGGRKEAPLEPQELEVTDLQAEARTSFSVVLHPTYYRQGFFNVAVDHQALFGADGETIELYLGSGTAPLLGTINRRANQNATPRIMGGAGLRDWFAATAAEMEAIQVDVLSPTSVRLLSQEPID